MILEEAYSSNPKPDKQARLDIVQRVSLNEKEVQVWINIVFVVGLWISIYSTRYAFLNGLGNIKLTSYLIRSGFRTEGKMTEENHVLYHNKNMLLFNLETCTLLLPTPSPTPPRLASLKRHSQ
jgi:hypothetical protein